ncbi:endonuclease Q family protein [Bacillus solimangrovi]|uniref:TIGR00375 family protein n=1 Tax=Bacillus solimangrovi TaxID=1305675 RepID=A0A1E5LHQ6_9BACI|nr:endonuclease Q family protein [Bacillus solimangrovi]OEH93601.1 hypothetical protein BFG57_01040 [Bacillus solimangrovi]
MQTYFADLHIHIGRTNTGRPVKITGSKSLTVANILYDAQHVKGMDMIGVIDSHVPEVLDELEVMVDKGELSELEQGGLSYGELTLILGSEIEVNDESTQGPIHVLCFMPTLQTMRIFSKWLGERITNNTLSTQRLYESGKVLQQKVRELGGLFIPAHIFTPHKSLYGSGVKFSLAEVFDPDLIDAVELGLSSNTEMADSLKELHRYSFLTNSDAHSTQKIGREYQILQLESPTFTELWLALHNNHDRKVIKNFGLDPKLGKYHETACERCGHRSQATEECSQCGSLHFVKGVRNRIDELTDGVINNNRPPYIHQIPLEFIPKLGPKTLQKLRDQFGTEMNIIHRISQRELEGVVSPKMAEMIIKARKGTLSLESGGAGKYGKVSSE